MPRTKLLVGLNADFRPSRKEGPALSFIPAGYYSAIQAAGGIPVILPPTENEADLGRLSLLDLSDLLDQAGDVEPVTKKLALHGPAQALQYRLVRFMKDVSVADLVTPGWRIDVPSERVGVNKKSTARAEPVTI